MRKNNATSVWNGIAQRVVIVCRFPLKGATFITCTRNINFLYYTRLGISLLQPFEMITLDIQVSCVITYITKGN